MNRIPGPSSKGVLYKTVLKILVTTNNKVGAKQAFMDIMVLSASPYMIALGLSLGFLFNFEANLASGANASIFSKHSNQPFWTI